MQTINDKTWLEWATETFEFENCEECGKGAEGHIENTAVMGNWFAFCKVPSGECVHSQPIGYCEVCEEGPSCGEYRS